VPPSSSFRAGYAYSNFGPTEGAIAAAKQTGKSWEDVAEEKLYRRLGSGFPSGIASKQEIERFCVSVTR